MGATEDFLEPGPDRDLVRAAEARERIGVDKRNRLLWRKLAEMAGVEPYYFGAVEYVTVAQLVPLADAKRRWDDRPRIDRRPTPRPRARARRLAN